MISSRSCLNNRVFAIFLIIFLCLSACTGPKATKTDALPQGTPVTIAVFPFENLSGTAAPLRAIRQSFIQELNRSGFRLVSDDALERFMLRNRVRYTSGIDETTAQALKKETGADAVLISSVELYNEGLPPKIALMSRLVSTGEFPVILWSDGVGMAGDDAPGILDLGLIEDPKVLLDKALRALTRSLVRPYADAAGASSMKGVGRKFQPKITYRSAALQQGNRQTVAVIPFFNESDRKNGGDILVLQFIKSLHEFPQFQVIEPGLVRNAFLTLRIVMDQGVSLADAGSIFAVLDADLVLAGKVFDYQDYQGPYGTPKVNFSLQLINRKDHKIVWSSMSRNHGDDGVFFFDAGKINTAHVMAEQMARSVGNQMVKKYD